MKKMHILLFSILFCLKSLVFAGPNSVSSKGSEVDLADLQQREHDNLMKRLAREEFVKEKRVGEHKKLDSAKKIQTFIKKKLTEKIEKREIEESDEDEFPLGTLSLEWSSVKKQIEEQRKLGDSDAVLILEKELFEIDEKIEKARRPYAEINKKVLKQLDETYAFNKGIKSFLENSAKLMEDAQLSFKLMKEAEEEAKRAGKTSWLRGFENDLDRVEDGSKDELEKVIGLRKDENYKQISEENRQEIDERVEMLDEMREDIMEFIGGQRELRVEAEEKKKRVKHEDEQNLAATEIQKIVRTRKAKKEVDLRKLEVKKEKELAEFIRIKKKTEEDEAEKLKQARIEVNEEVSDIVEQFTDSDDIDFSLQESVSDSDSDGYSPDDNSNFGRDSVEPISDNVDELDKFFETRNTNENLVPIGHRHIKHGKGSRVSPVDLKSKSKAEQVWYAALWKTMRGWFGLNQPSTKVAPAQ